MRTAAKIHVLAAALLLGGCADSSGPGPIGRSRRSSSTGDTSTVQLADTTVVPAPLRFVAGAPRLTTYDTTFTVVQGKASTDTLFFRPAFSGARPMPFLVLATPKDAQFVSATGVFLKKGSTVALTVHVDSVFVQINFGPHGSTFTGNPAVLCVNWWYTDLTGHPSRSLKVWYQAADSATWSALPTLVDMQFYWLRTTLEHFSNYRVAF